jgi:type VI secretion system protein VasD
MKTALSFTVLWALAACSSAPVPQAKPPPKGCPPVQPELSLSATKRVNPSVDGEGRPVQVRVYQLVSDAKLRNATFEEIWQKDREVLRTDLKAVAEHTIFPGETKRLSLKKNPAAHTLALVALFREPQGKDWFVTYELTEAPSSPPCASPAPLPVFLDRMQIQDGNGRADGAGEVSGPAAGESAPAEHAEKTGKRGRVRW